MLHRNIDEGTLLVSQPAHAWVSGQLAAAWGNILFGLVEPYSEVCLAAEQHDIGWLDWELAPTLNPATGLPRTFMELPTSEHVGIWASAGLRALVYGPYVALLVSLHGTGLYQKHDFTRDSIEEAEAARRFIAEGAEFEERLLDQMAEEPRYSAFIDPGIVDRNRRLVAAWDYLSLALCGGIADQRRFAGIPSVEGPVSLLFQRIDQERERFSVEPWPFSIEAVRLVSAGRLLKGTFSDQQSMRAAIDRAEWRSLEFELVPG